MSTNRWTAKAILAIAVMLGVSGLACADDPVDYAKQIKPILKARCYACHGALKQQADLRLDTGDRIRRGGDSGVAVVPEKPDASLLIERVSAQDVTKRMPPEGEPLSAAQIEGLRAWITQGAKSPDGEAPESDPREHWAFRPPQRPALPARVESDERRHPVDAFLDAELDRHGLTPRPLAPKHVLLRRVYLDLIGLPPTRDELLAFLKDESPDAYEQIVDRLLKDPRHGERWGRHWMDIWRYSDWYGRRDANDVRNSASQIFRWRDWIVRSLNEGKGYDRMVQEMLAADEICPEDYEAGVATGYLIRNYYSLNPNDWMRSTVEHTGKAFLGLTFNCAHCHDHKYDPIENDDYFRLRAFFEPIFIRQDRVPGEADPGMFQDYTYAGSRSVQRLGAVRVFDRNPQAPTWFYTKGDERNRVKERGSIPPGVPGFLANAPLRIEPVKLPPRAWYPGLRPEIQETLLVDARRAIASAEESIAALPAAPEAQPTNELAQAEAAYDRAVQQAKQAGRPGALSGSQSLLLDATTGRRILQNGLRSLKALEDGTTLEFELLILQDTHVNFQFAKDVVKGLTAGYLAFEQGRIRSYQPGSFTEFEAGRYDFAAGQTRFRVSLVLQTKADQCLLTVRSVSDDMLLADRIPAALNGWNPVGDETKAITFDARTGSVVVVDDIVLNGPAMTGTSPNRLLTLDFEPPKYADGVDAAGIDGWIASSFGAAPATSVVSGTAGNKELREVASKLKVAQRAARGPLLRREAAEAKRVAARAALAGLEARIAADRVQFGEQSGEDATALKRTASRLEREAAVRKAEGDLLASELALLDAEAKPAGDANRAKTIDAASKNLTAARTAVDQARNSLADEKLAESYSPLSPTFPQESTGRRRALSEWITGRDNPLTARVAVNHIWTRHFHAPLVASVYDFGRNGARPTHPELLDWLAVEFIESGWDMKHLHRLIVTSQAYRRDTVSSTANSIDPENKLLWRMNVARMESEVVRDSLLYVAGRLDFTIGGVELENKDALTTNRRSLYYSVYPESGGKSELGALFDAPDPLDCYRRTSSILPQQALALTNSDLVHQSSTAIVATWQQGQSAPAPTEAAQTEVAQRGGDAESQRFIVEMFEQILSRPPTKTEERVCFDGLERQRRLAVKPDSAEAMTQARESLVRVLLNHNDFVTVR